MLMGTRVARDAHGTIGQIDDRFSLDLWTSVDLFMLFSDRNYF